MPENLDHQSRKQQGEQDARPQKPQPPNDTSANNKPPQPSQSQMFMTALSWLLVISSVIYLWTDLSQVPRAKVSYSLFKQELKANNIVQVLIKEQEIIGSFRHPVNSGRDTSRPHVDLQLHFSSDGVFQDSCRLNS